MTGHAIAKSTLIAGFMILSSSPALADAIDGEWCATTEIAHFSIAGPRIITPAGTQTTGDYRRHAFSYVVPAGEPGAGQTIVMRLLNEEEVRVFVEDAAPRIWRRCELIS